MADTITRKALRKRLEHGDHIVLVDTLPGIDYTYAHLPGALNIPHDRLDELAPRLLLDRSAEIVVYHANAFHTVAESVAGRLERLGFTRVTSYRGGKQDWMEAGLPTESCLRPARCA